VYVYSLNSEVVTSDGSGDIATPVRQKVTLRSGCFFEAQEKVGGATIKSFTAYILAQLKCDRPDLAERFPPRAIIPTRANRLFVCRLGIEHAVWSTSTGSPLVAMGAYCPGWRLFGSVRQQVLGTESTRQFPRGCYSCRGDIVWSAGYVLVD